MSGTPSVRAVRGCLIFEVGSDDGGHRLRRQRRSRDRGVSPAVDRGEQRTRLFPAGNSSSRRAQKIAGGERVGVEVLGEKPCRRCAIQEFEDLRPPLVHRDRVQRLLVRGRGEPERVNAADDQRLSLDVNVVAVQGADLLETQPRRGEEEQ